MSGTTTTNDGLRLQAHTEYSYVPRTGENARGADVTVAFAVDFNSAGEKLTKREAGARYIAINYGIDPAAAAELLCQFMVQRKGSSLNVAGNGIYTMSERGITQAKANQWVFDVLSLVMRKVKLTFLRSGGQTGIDQAGLVAAVALGISALGLYPKSFRRRDVKGVEIHSSEQRMREEILLQASELVIPRKRRFHADGSTPAGNGIFVFGSNLAGRHGAGSARAARLKFGAIYGQAAGLQGRSYAIPTKDGRPGTPDLTSPAATLPLKAIKASIEVFIKFAKEHPEMDFHVARLGCALATHENGDIAPLFQDAPDNCSFPEPWEPWLGQPSLTGIAPAKIAESINIWSGARGIGGALTNMSELARSKGGIKHPYPVTVNGTKFVDSEAAYQALKIPGDDDYNDGLMIDIISLKLAQNAVLREVIDENGGAEWLRKCSHFTGAKSERFQAWEGQGYGGSRFIRNLVHGYEKLLTGQAPVTRVVHVDDAPFDVYIGRAMGMRFTASIWQNRNKLTSEMQRGEAVGLFYEDLQKDPALIASLSTLKGKTLGCWCRSRKDRSRLCHGDVLAALADGREWVAPTAAQQTLF